MSKKWKKLLNHNDIYFLVGREEAGYLEMTNKVETLTDEDIVLAFEADWKDALHNGNMPWDKDFRKHWETWYKLLNKLGYDLNFEVSAIRFR